MQKVKLISEQMSVQKMLSLHEMCKIKTSITKEINTKIIEITVSYVSIN